MINLTIAGTVGRDAELRNTQGGDAVLGFSIAVDNGKDKNGNKREATWVNCSIWGKRAESLRSHITKGTKLALTGRPGVNVYEGKGSLTLSVNDLTFMGGAKQEDRGGYDQSPSGYNAGGRPSNDIDDDLPFAAEWRV
jgi:single-strand DNA-binding protein